MPHVPYEIIAVKDDLIILESAWDMYGCVKVENDRLEFSYGTDKNPSSPKATKDNRSASYVIEKLKK